MEPLEQEEDIMEEQNIRIEYIRKNSNDIDLDNTYKYASVAEIRTFERVADTHNQKLIDQRPNLLGEDEFMSSSTVHFVNQKGKQIYSRNQKEESAVGVLLLASNHLKLKIPVTNIKCENILILHLKNLKRRIPIELLSIEVGKDEQTTRYKYVLTLSDINLCIRVLVKLGDQYKVWKEIEVPLTENRFRLEIHEFSNEHTDIKINDFLFHLILKMPYHEQTNYLFRHEGKAEIEKIEFMSKYQKKSISPQQGACSGKCQIM